MVTHCSTNRTIRCLSTAERTGCEIFIVLWPNTLAHFRFEIYPGVENGLSLMWKVAWGDFGWLPGWRYGGSRVLEGRGGLREWDDERRDLV